MEAGGRAGCQQKSRKTAQKMPSLSALLQHADRKHASGAKKNSVHDELILGEAADHEIKIGIDSYAGTTHHCIDCISRMELGEKCGSPERLCRRHACPALESTQNSRFAPSSVGNYDVGPRPLVHG